VRVPVFRARTTDDWCERLRAEGQRFARVQDYAGVAVDPQVWENGYLVQVDHPHWGPVNAIGSPLRLSETPTVPGVVAPELGQDTESVLLAEGYTWEELAALRAGGAW
jgi:crotonobetainyl-CoA:carnitine CoA-transferase CaiB-like acyl-CoA transferase